jgi:hypothetical protein
MFLNVARASPPVVVARPHQSPMGRNAGLTSHSVVHSNTGRVHGVAETVAFTGDRIAVLLHLLTEILQVVPWSRPSDA